MQFIHRMTGYVLFAFAIVVWLRGRKSAHEKTRRAFNLAFIAITAQVVLGITTVMVAAIMPVALAHQGLAVLCFVLILRARHLSLYPIATSLRGATT